MKKILFSYLLAIMAMSVYGQNERSDKGHETNPYYSTTDTTKLNNRSRFIENFFLSFSFFLSLIPTVNETFNRVPIGHPLAHGSQDPLIGKTLLLLLVLFIIGSVLQFRKQNKINRSL